MTTNHTMRTLKLARHTLLVLAVFFYLHPGAVQAAAPHGAGTTMDEMPSSSARAQPCIGPPPPSGSSA